MVLMRKLDMYFIHGFITSNSRLPLHSIPLKTLHKTEVIMTSEYLVPPHLKV